MCNFSWSHGQGEQHRFRDLGFAKSAISLRIRGWRCNMLHAEIKCRTLSGPRRYEFVNALTMTLALGSPKERSILYQISIISISGSDSLGLCRFAVAQNLFNLLASTCLNIATLAEDSSEAFATATSLGRKLQCHNAANRCSEMQ